MDLVTVATDGSYLPNEKVGGWACRFFKDDQSIELVGSSKMVSSIEAELRAVVQALKAIPATERKRAIVVTDSQYPSIIQTKYDSWIEQGKHCEGKNKNVPSWYRKHAKVIDELAALLMVHEVWFHWLPGHASNEHNKRCDKLAKFSAQAYAKRNVN